MREVEWVEVNVNIAASRDPSDDKFLELAASGGATHIISRDKDLLSLNPFMGKTILTPEAFLRQVR